MSWNDSFSIGNDVEMNIDNPEPVYRKFSDCGIIIDSQSKLNTEKQYGRIMEVDKDDTGLPSFEIYPTDVKVQTTSKVTDMTVELKFPR